MYKPVECQSLEMDEKEEKRACMGKLQKCVLPCADILECFDKSNIDDIKYRKLVKGIQEKNDE